MSAIDKQRIAAVSKLEELGYTFSGGEWVAENDAMVAVGHGVYRLLMKRPEDVVLSEDQEEVRPCDLISWEWIPGKSATVPVGDGMYRLMVARTKELAGSKKGSDEARELSAIDAAREWFLLDWGCLQECGWLETDAELNDPARK